MDQNVQLEKQVGKKSKILSFIQEKVDEVKNMLIKSNSKQLYADCIIRNEDGEILLLQRSFNDDFMPGKWCLPGGKIEPGENPTQAAGRELMEETCLSISPLDFLKTIEKPTCTINYFQGLLENNKDDNGLMLLDNEEHYRYEWVCFDHLDRYELLFDLHDVLNELKTLLHPMPIIGREPEYLEGIMLKAGDEFLEKSQINDEFDKGSIDEACFLKYLETVRAYETIKKAHDQGMITDDKFYDILEKAKHFEFVKVIRDGKQFFQYREVGTDKLEEEVGTGDEINAEPLGLKIKKYSDKSYLITGETLKNLELLRKIKSDLGYGTWVKGLNGWVFPSFNKEKILAALASKMPVGTYDETVQKEAAIELKNAVEVGTEVIVDGAPVTVDEITTNEEGKVEYTIKPNEIQYASLEEAKEGERKWLTENSNPKEEYPKEEYPIGTISPDGTKIKTANGWEHVKKEKKKVTEEEVGIPPATDEKAEELINNATEENRMKTGKELFGKEEGEKPASAAIEEAGQNQYLKAPVKEFTTRSGAKVQALDYSHVKMTDVQLYDQDGILDKPQPYWIPRINEREFAGYKDHRFIFSFVKQDDDTILVHLNSKGEKASNTVKNDQLRQALIDGKHTSDEVRAAKMHRDSSTGTSYIKIGEETYNYGTDISAWRSDQEAMHCNQEAEYAVVSIDQLVGIQDYYVKKRKAELERVNQTYLEKEIEGMKSWKDSQMDYYKPFNYTRLSASQKKKYSEEAWNALSYDEKVKEIPNMTKPVFQKKKTRITVLDDAHIPGKYFDMFKKLVDPNDKGDTGGRYFDSRARSAIEFQEIRKQLIWKRADLQVQREENDGAFEKGRETSYGDSGTKDTLLETHGVKVKNQNGSEITADRVEQIKLELNNVYSSFGNRSLMAKEFGLKISHSGEKLMHAKTALGIYIPSMKAIGVSNNPKHDKFGFTLAHEFAHFIDNYVGKKGGRHYASDNFNSTAGQIANVFRDNMNKAADSPYLNRTCECFARAFEQYHAIKNEGDDAVKSRSIGVSYHESPEHVSKDKFNTLVKPLIEQFLKENDHVLKSAFASLDFGAMEDSFDLIKSAFDNEEIRADEFLEYQKKYADIIKAGDPSHGGTLEKVVIMDKNGKKETKWISKEEAGKSNVEPGGKTKHTYDKLHEFARDTPASELKRVINESHDEKLRKAAHKELDRRNNKEAVQKPGDKKPAAKKPAEKKTEVKEPAKKEEEHDGESKQINDGVKFEFKHNKSSNGFDLFVDDKNTGLGARNKSDQSKVLSEYKKSSDFKLIKNKANAEKEGEIDLGIEGIKFNYKIDKEGFYQIFESTTKQKIPFSDTASLDESKKRATEFINKELGLEKFKKLVGGFKS
jgi:mutator protein MutT